MRFVRLLAIAFFIQSVGTAATGQQVPTAQQLQPAAASTTKTIPEQLRSTVAFLRVTYLDGSQTMQIAGTCFFAYVPDNRLGENKGFSYLVTNRHMAEPGIEKGVRYPVQGAYVRMNLKIPLPESGSVEVPLPMGGRLHWFFPDDPAVDLAIFPIAPDVEKVDSLAISTSTFATPEEIKALAVDTGDPVFFAGYFYQFPGQRRIEPIVRQGVIAMMPDEPVMTTLQKPGKLYLADVHAFHGNSGSPLVVNLGGYRNGTLSGPMYLLIGIISGYYAEATSYNLPAATVLTGEVLNNSGIAIVVPVEELSKLLNLPSVQADRDSQVSVLTQHK